MSIIESAKDMLKSSPNSYRSHKDIDLDRRGMKFRLDNPNINATDLVDDFHMPMPKEKTLLTTESGNPVDDNSNSMTAGERGPILLQDVYLLEKIQHFTREKIPERMVHARGSGAYGYLELTEDISKYCKAKLFQRVGEQIPLFARFSLVVVSKGEPETTRDLRGFAMKFYTEEGNWDLLCTNLPVFPVRDAIKMMDMVHAMRKHPQTNIYDANSFWDFFSQSPESIHALTMMFTDRGVNDGYRKMHAYGNHTFQMVNSKDEVFFVKFHLISDQGAKGLTIEESKRIAGVDPDYYTRDLYDNISQGNFPSWTFCLQIMPEKDAINYKYDIFDVTKVWPHGDYPLIKIGKIVINKLPNNFFMESEQVAFNPANLIPGIEPTPDKLLQTRLFTYRDAQLYRLASPNYQMLSVNCPFNAKVANHERNGHFTVSSSGTGFPNYEPNSFGGPLPDKKYKWHQYEVKGKIGRFPYNYPNDDFEQCGNLYSKVLNQQDRERLILNICNFLGKAKKELQIRQCMMFYRVHRDYGLRVASMLGLNDMVEKWKEDIKTGM